MRFSQSIKHNEQGAVAIITVLLLVIVLSILTLGFLRLSINEQRQAIDDDLSARAYYAAEAGLSDARVMLKNAANAYIVEVAEGYSGNFQSYLNANYNAGNCNTATGFDSVVSEPDDLDMEYTCLKLSAAPEWTGELGEGDVQTIILPGQADGANIAWHKTPEQGAGAPTNDGHFDVSTDVEKELLRKDDWNERQYPALLRVTFFYREGIEFRQRTVFLYPFSDSQSPFSNFSGAFDGGIHATYCEVLTVEFFPGEFACVREIRNLPTNSDIIAVAVSTRYRSATVKVTATRWSEPGNTGERVDVGMDQGQIIADVTGRSGDVFRRIEATLDLNRIFFKALLQIPDDTVDGWIDPADANYITISGNSLCKTFATRNTAENFASSWCDF